MLAVDAKTNCLFYFQGYNKPKAYIAAQGKSSFYHA